MVAVFPPQSSNTVCSPPLIPPTIHRRRCPVVTPRASRDHPLSSSKLFSSGLQKSPRIINFRCNSSRDSGENESRTILDAFFLGRALAEALNERIESSVGEFLSTIGRVQAEQQKQVQEFQDEVLEKARRAKEQAAREAMEAKGLIPKVSAVDIPPVNGVASKSPSATDSIDLSISSTEQDPPTDED